MDNIYLEFATGDNEGVRLANVIITWNIFQHFYPYFDVVDIDWEEQLSLALRRALEDNTAEDFYLTLNQMLASLQDGHIHLRHPSAQNRASFPFLVDWVENKVVITHSIDDQFLAGDIVVMVDGIHAETIIDSTKHLISGSPQLSQFRALRQFGSGEPQSEANITLLRGSDEFEITALRSWYSSIRNIDRNHLPVIEEIEEGIYFVDLDRASMEEIRDYLEEIAAANGVIFDLRGYPYNNHDVLRHLLNRPDIPNSLMQIPKVIYPDQKDIIYESRKWYLQPASPQIEGKVVFITDARAISYAETFLSFVEHNKLGEIVGQPTAGANGNTNRVSLPGGYTFGWTGMRVLKHDDSQHHLIGIQPTIQVEKTFQGVREERDEFLEKALEIIKLSSQR